MTKEEAIKKVNTSSNNNWMIVNFTWGKTLIFPWEDGLKVLNAFKQAEMLVDDYDLIKTKIEPAKQDTITVALLPDKKYKDIKVAELLGMSYKDYIDEPDQ
jgi:hypothetical protein